MTPRPVEPWTCGNWRCRHFNTKARFICESCWTPRTIKLPRPEPPPPISWQGRDKCEIEPKAGG